MAKVENLEPQIRRLSKLTLALKERSGLATLRTIAEEPDDGGIEGRDPKKTVLLCGGDRLSRAGLHALILLRHELRVVAEVDDSAALVNVAGRLQPNVIVLDLASKAADDPQLSRGLREAAPHTRLLAIAPARGQEWRRRAMRVGAVDFVTKQEAASIFLDSIERISDPKPVAVAPRPTVTNETSPFQEPLSARELDVARLVCEGLRNERIGQRLFISETTVRHHLTAIFAKRQVVSRAELIVDSHRNRFLELSSSARSAGKDHGFLLRKIP